MSPASPCSCALLLCRSSEEMAWYRRRFRNGRCGLLLRLASGWRSSWGFCRRRSSSKKLDWGANGEKRHEGAEQKIVIPRAANKLCDKLDEQGLRGQREEQAARPDKQQQQRRCEEIVAVVPRRRGKGLAV